VKIIESIFLFGLTHRPVNVFPRVMLVPATKQSHVWCPVKVKQYAYNAHDHTYSVLLPPTAWKYLFYVYFARELGIPQRTHPSIHPSTNVAET